MQLIVVSNPDAVDGEADVINALFNEGLELFHLRKPGSRQEDMAELVQAIERRYQQRIVWHQHHELCEQFGSTRVHLPESRRREMQAGEWEEMKKKGYTLSTSVHAMGDYDTLPEGFSYTFYGPVFDSISKQGYKPTGEIPAWPVRKNRRTSVMAIGGVEPGNIHRVKQLSFDGAALLGAIWRNPKQAVPVFRECMNAMKRTV